MLKKYKCTTGVFDPKLYPEVSKAIRKECREFKVPCSRRDAIFVVRVLLQVSYDAANEPNYCGKGRKRQLDSTTTNRLWDILRAVMRPNVTNPVAGSAHYLCNERLTDGAGFRHTIWKRSIRLQVVTSDMSLADEHPVALVLR